MTPAAWSKLVSLSSFFILLFLRVFVIKIKYNMTHIRDLYAVRVESEFRCGSALFGLT